MATCSSPEAAALPALEVFWRPGCPYCYRLIDVLEAVGIRLRLHNIWEDEAARAIVVALNNGDETVPTVVVEGRSATNPPPEELIDLLRAEHPELFATADS